MASKNPICNGGKSYLIDPNLLFGQGIDENIYVTPEDLNIYVELTTSKKNRSIIDITDNGLEAVSTDVGKSRVSFIDGTENGKIDETGQKKKSLTTSYTELTTVFNKTADTEKFGITSIDIDFNSAYAPLIHIEFVDVRGASLFNSGNPPKSEYASFFDLPYPIFQLKVKGYYGKPVKYCLHLTKWNARFNAKTGNFEISADFIGYTYALLSDMLLGYLRAIVETDAGYAKFLQAKSEMIDDRELITINELLDKIVDVNEAIVKLQEKDADIKELSKNKELASAIDSVQNLLKEGMANILEPDASSVTGYALLNSGDGLIGVRNLPQDEAQTNTNLEDLITWKDAMKTQVGELNASISPESQFNIDDFAGEKVPLYYQNFIYDEIVSGNTTTNSKQLDFRNAWNLNDEKSYNDFITRMASISKNTATRKQNMSIYDFSKTIKTIADIKSNINKLEESIKETVAIKIKQTFIDLIGFEPTIGSIFRIFTVHAEIFLERLKEVSIKAELDIDGLRRGQVEGLRDKFDIHQSTSSVGGALPSKIYAWPLFRKPSKDANKGGTLEEAYLGDTEDGVKIPQNVPELVFVEELLDGLIKVAKDDAARQERLDNPNTIVNSWFPINVLDTPLFGVMENPYKTPTIGDSNNPLDPLKLMMMRAFVFLGASNRGLYDSGGSAEIKLMGTLEANTCFEGVINKTVKQAMITADGDDINADNIITYFKEGKKGDRNVSFKFGENSPLSANPRPLFGEFNGNYAYTYVSSAPSDGAFSGSTVRRTYIPFNGNFDGSEFFTKTGNNFISATPNELYLKSYWTKPDNGLLFIEPNYRDVDGFFSETGAVLMKIFDENEYEGEKALVPNYVEQTDIIQQMISAVKNQEGVTEYLDSGTLYTVERNNEKIPIGYNIFGDATSRFAFTTIKQVDITKLENNGGSAEKKVPITGSELGIMPLKALFYVNQNSAFGATSLARAPKVKGELEGNDAKHKGNFDSISNIDFYNTRYKSTAAREYFNFSNSNTNNPDLGKNRELFNDVDVYIPHVDFIVTNRRGGNEYSIYSLFGSQFYFEQRRSSSPKAAKALLFLHTFPWNQLYTDNTTKYSELAAIFDNDEGYTISNLFDRKSAFLNVPYLWCAFIGGVLWRMDERPIIFEDDLENADPSGKVPSYKGGSGTFDPIVWGERFDPTNPLSKIKRTTCPIYDYVDAWKDEAYLNVENVIDMDNSGLFPFRNQYLTSFTADGPLELDTDGNYKSIERTLKLLPLQIKTEFKRMFFDFVTSQEWINIRANYEMKNINFDWDKPNVGTTPEYKENGYVTTNVWSDGTINWSELWTNSATLAPNGDLEYSAIINYDSPGPLDQGQYYIQTPKKDGPIIPSESKRSGGIIGIKATTVESFKNWVNYEYLQPIRQWPTPNNYPVKNDLIEVKYNWDMSFRKNDKNIVLVDLFKRGVWIANASFKSWTAPKVVSTDGTVLSDGATIQEKYRDNFVVSPEALKLYVTSFVTEWKRLLKLNNEKKEEDELKQQLFNTMDNNTIRLNIYRHCKSVYDKWIAGTSGGVISACGSSDKKKVDLALNTLKRKSGSPHRLIDSFRFVNRGFNDLSDTYLLNPTAIGDIVQGNMNQSFYDMISRVLSDNNFNFIALPAYIDFNSTTEMEALFKPEIFNDTLSDEISGPTFVCVYVGQSSNKLDLGNGSDFPNDGFDFRCDSNGNLESGEGKLPKDFSQSKKDHEHNVIAFAVNYGHQNQNIFTDIKLDQQEFAETDESLQITDAIANNGSQSNRTQAGQNLWNVYQVRSYSTQIEAMGNAMIQPMMYFQLNNIPMFHGAYMIINAKHNITPNFMKTTFKGVRTRYIDTPQVDAQTLYMSMLGTLSDVDGASYSPGNVGSSGGSGGSNRSINQTAIDNSNGLFVRSAGGKTFVWNVSDGFAGKTLRAFMVDLEKYLQKTHPSKKITLGSNGITRSIEAVIAGGKSRSTSSKHGAGLAIDLLFGGIYNGKELGPTTGCKKSGLTCYGWYDGNIIVAKDTAIMQSIRTFVDTDSKWKNIIKWGADFGGNGLAGRTKISGFPNNGEARIDELHHFEIKDGIISQYIPNEAKTIITKLGIPIPNKQSDLPALYNYVLKDDASTKGTDPGNGDDGDGVDDEDKIKQIKDNGLAGTLSNDRVTPLTKEQMKSNLGKI